MQTYRYRGKSIEKEIGVTGLVQAISEEHAREVIATEINGIEVHTVEVYQPWGFGAWSAYVLLFGKIAAVLGMILPWATAFDGPGKDGNLFDAVWTCVISAALFVVFTRVQHLQPTLRIRN